MSDIKRIIKETADAPIYFSILVLGGLLILYSLIYNPQYILSGFATLFYAVIGASIRLFYKDIRDYKYENTPPIWFNAGYHIVQLIFVGVWLWITVYYLFPYSYPITETSRGVWGYHKKYIFMESGIVKWIGVIGTLILGALAIFGEQIRKLIFIPKLEFIGTNILPQKIALSGTTTYYRLMIRNNGSSPAFNVRSNIIKLIENGQERQIIPIPLNWTHIDASTRDISKGEVVYLDVFRKNDNNYSFCWPGEKAPHNEKILMQLNSDKETKLYLDFFENDRKLQSIALLFNPSSDKFSIDS